MRKIRFVIPAIAVGLAIGSPGIASAAPQPVAGCSNGYELMTVKSVLHTIAAPGFEESIQSFDVNGDGYLCIKIIPNGGAPPQVRPCLPLAGQQDLRICLRGLDSSNRAGKDS